MEILLGEKLHRNPQDWWPDTNPRFLDADRNLRQDLVLFANTFPVGTSLLLDGQKVASVQGSRDKHSWDYEGQYYSVLFASELPIRGGARVTVETPGVCALRNGAYVECTGMSREDLG